MVQNEFDLLAPLISDGDVSLAEKQISKLKDSDLTNLKNVLWQNLLFVAVIADKIKMVELLIRFDFLVFGVF